VVHEEFHTAAGPVRQGDVERPALVNETEAFGRPADSEAGRPPSRATVIESSRFSNRDVALCSSDANDAFIGDPVPRQARSPPDRFASGVAGRVGLERRSAAAARAASAVESSVSGGSNGPSSSRKAWRVCRSGTSGGRRWRAGIRDWSWARRSGFRPEPGGGVRRRAGGSPPIRRAWRSADRKRARFGAGLHAAVDADAGAGRPTEVRDRPGGGEEMVVGILGRRSGPRWRGRGRGAWGHGQRLPSATASWRATRSRPSPTRDRCSTWRGCSSRGSRNSPRSTRNFTVRRSGSPRLWRWRRRRGHSPPGSRGKDAAALRLGSWRIELRTRSWWVGAQLKWSAH